MLGALGRQRPPVTVICHNVLPHEPRPGDRKLARAVLSRCDQVIVHSGAQAELAAELTSKPVQMLELPLPRLYKVRKSAKEEKSRQLLFFGFIRPYKGVDILLEALVKVPGVHLTIAGEVWGDKNQYPQLIKKLGLEERVTLRDGYIPAHELAELIAGADAVALPYRAGTASWNVRMAQMYGTPVIATAVGSHAAQIRDDIDGLLCQPDDVAALAAALKHFYEPGIAARLRKAVPKVSPDKPWREYVEAIISG
jgi:glycosyltransferase involved in cell wall biosynthesis